MPLSNQSAQTCVLWRKANIFYGNNKKEESKTIGSYCRTTGIKYRQRIESIAHKQLITKHSLISSIYFNGHGHEH